MGKEGLPLTSDVPLEDTLTIRDVISQAKVAEKPKDGNARSKTTTTKEDPQPKKKQLQDFNFLLFSLLEIYFIACNTSSLKLMNESFLLFFESLLFALFEPIIIISNEFKLLLLYFQHILSTNHY